MRRNFYRIFKIINPPKLNFLKLYIKMASIKKKWRQLPFLHCSEIQVKRNSLKINKRNQEDQSKHDFRILGKRYSEMSQVLIK